MTAYDVSEWADFANTVAGGAAALAGLLFVGLSLNLAEVLKYPGGRPLLGNRFCGNGFHRGNGQRPGAAGRDQTLAG